MALEIEVQTGELFTSPVSLARLMLVVGGHQLLPAIDKNGDAVTLNTAAIVWIKET